MKRLVHSPIVKYPRRTNTIIPIKYNLDINSLPLESLLSLQQEWCPRHDSNVRPSPQEGDALSPDNYPNLLFQLYFNQWLMCFLVYKIKSDLCLYSLNFFGMNLTPHLIFFSLVLELCSNEEILYSKPYCLLQLN